MAPTNSENLGGVPCVVSTRARAGDAPINRRLDLPVFLSEWATEKGKGDDFVGNVRVVAELVRILELHQPETLLDILERAHDAYETTRDTRYDPLPPTLATYMMGGMLKLPEVQNRLDESLRSRSWNELLRYKIKVIRNSFLWLGELMTARSDWVDQIIPDNGEETNNRVKLGLRWLLDRETRKFCEECPGVGTLTESEKLRLEDLWRIFDDNEMLPIRIAFCLARLDPENWSGGWARLFDILRPLQQDWDSV
ncbi:hypothetical protein BJX76DRAFT_359972 [Aspergillus varians]